MGDCHGFVGPSLGLELPLMLMPDPKSVAKMGTGFLVLFSSYLDKRVLFDCILPREQKSGTAFKFSVPAKTRWQVGLPWI